MSQGEEPASVWPRPLARDYTILSLVALLLLALLLQDRGFGWLSLAPVVLGGLSLASNWGPGPALVVLSVLVLLAMQIRLLGRWRLMEESTLLDMLLAGCLLLYVASATRLLSLTRHTVPPDPRRAKKPTSPRIRGRWFLPTTAAVRSGKGPSSEVVMLLLAVPAYTVAACLVWIRLAVEPLPDWLDATPTLWHALLVLWGLALALMAAYAFLAYLGRAQAGPEESMLYLQDQLWAATRGEQRRMNRWIVWRRLRAGRREDRS